MTEKIVFQAFPATFEMKLSKAAPLRKYAQVKLSSGHFMSLMEDTPLHAKLYEKMKIILGDRTPLQFESLVNMYVSMHVPTMFTFEARCMRILEDRFIPYINFA